MPDPVQRAAIAWEMHRSQGYEEAKKVIQAIHESADERGKQMVNYLDAAKDWVKEMKEIAGT